MSSHVAPPIGGTVAPGYETVRDAFAENFTRRGELGGAVCVYRDGEKVVDLWGGARDATGAPWQERTMVLVHSTTKGLAAMVVALAHSRGWLDWDERVATYWPEFAANGKAAITIRQLLAHQAGLFAFDEHVDVSVVADLDRLAGVMARQRPAWPPGERQAYHAITLGFYESEILRRVDPKHRTLGRIFAEEIAAPLGVDFHIGLPASIPDDRIAALEPPTLREQARNLRLLFGFTMAALQKRSVLHRALTENPGTSFYLDAHHRPLRGIEAPSGNGVGNARGIARAYGVFATGGRELGLRPETIAALEADAIPATVGGFHDECFGAPARFSLGFMKPSETIRFGTSSRAYGAPGTGGSVGYADPDTRTGYAYVTSRMGLHLEGDPRDLALREALAKVSR
jgi:CubicO group peptidase (beta-lactamase class C family)